MWRESPTVCADLGAAGEMLRMPQCLWRGKHCLVN